MVAGKRFNEGNHDNGGNYKKQKASSSGEITIDGSALNAYLTNNARTFNTGGVSSVEGTPEVEFIIKQTEEDLKNADNGVKSGVIWNKNDRRQPVDENGIPLDIIRARRYLEEKFDLLEEESRSNKLLQKKHEEDEGIQPETDDEEGSDDEEFEDLLETFDINPDEISLDLTLNQKRKLLLDSMDENQLKRYEFFRRTNLNIGGIKKLINSVTGISIPNSNNDFAKLVGGIGKVFVGEIIEMAKQVQREENEARVLEQIQYKMKLKEYEDHPERFTKKPELPSFYEQLQQQETGMRRRVDSNSMTYTQFRIIVPQSNGSLNAASDSANTAEPQLAPDHIREAYRRLNAYNKLSLSQKPERGHSANGRLF